MISHYNMEANVCHHCNSRCACCNHLSPFAPPYFMEPASLERDLGILGRLMHIDLFALQGGEPLLHPQIIDLMRILAASKFATAPGILSNGKLLDRMPDDFWRTAAALNIDVRVTVYPNLPPETVAVAKAKAAQLGAKLWLSPLGSFVKMLKDNPNGESFAGCPWKTCWAVHDGYFFACPIAIFLAPQHLGLPWQTDGLPISDATTESDINAYLARKEPFKSCVKCTGAQAEWVPWHQVNTLEEWIKDSTV